MAKMLYFRKTKMKENKDKMDDGGSPNIGLFQRIVAKLPFVNSEDVTEEEIISMVNEGHEQGVLLESEAEMIHNIFEFGDKEAKDIMTHRKNMIALDGNSTFKEAISFMIENKNSRFPVYLDNIDNIIGVLHIKEALLNSQNQSLMHVPIKDIDGLVRSVDFIPETRNINILFKKMQSAKNHMVIVVDEYGQTAGLVAMEDILEEIVGNIFDEHDEEDILIERQADGSYIINGMAPLEEVGEVLDIDFEEEDYDTLNGLIISLIDKIPCDNELFEVKYLNYEFHVLATEDKIIKSVHVMKMPQSDSGQADVSSCQIAEKMVE